MPIFSSTFPTSVLRPALVTDPTQGRTLNAATRRRERGVSVLLVAAIIISVLVGTFLRLWYLFHTPVTSDQAVAGLVAIKALHGHFSAFFPGQPFGGVEPYVVAGVFSLLGKGFLQLCFAPWLLSVAASLVVWRLGTILTKSSLLGGVAGALSYVGSVVVMQESAREGGYRGVTLLMGLLAMLCLVHLYERLSYSWAASCGLALGVGWWSLAEIGYFAPFLLIVGVSACWVHREALWRVVCTGLCLLGAFVLGAAPWLVTNVTSGFASIQVGSFAGAPASVNLGYGGRLHLFFSEFLLQTNFYSTTSGTWITHTISDRHGYVLLFILGLLLSTLLVALYGALRSGWLGRGLVATLCAFPFLLAAQPGTWYWQDGRYVVYLLPLLALTIVVGLKEVSRRIALRSGVVASGRLGLVGVTPLMGLFIACCLVGATMFSIVAFSSARGLTPQSVLSNWGSTNSKTTKIAHDLVAAGVRTGYGDYWVVYKLDFANTALRLSTAGTDPVRDLALENAVAQSSRPVWLFVPRDRLGALSRAFSPTVDLQGPSGRSEAAFLAALSKDHIAYSTAVIDGIDVITPARALGKNYSF